MITMKPLSIFLYCCFSLSLASIKLCAQDKIDFNGYHFGIVKFEFSIDSLQEGGVKEVNDVILSFFEIFDDSLVVYSGKNQIWTGSLYKKNNPFISTGWSGFNLSLKVYSKMPFIFIKMVKKKEYIKIPIFKNSSIFMI